MRGLVTLTLAAAALTILTIRRRFGPWAVARALAEYTVLVLLVALLATSGAGPPAERAQANSTRPPAATQQAASLPPGISQVVGAGQPPGRRRPLAGRAVGPGQGHDRAAPAHPTQAQQRSPNRSAVPTRRISTVTKFRHIPVAGRLIIVTVAIGVFAIAVVACATSYNAIYRLVGDLGLYGYRINQAFPLMLDAAFLVAELAAILGGIMRAVTRSDEVSAGWPGTTMLLCGAGTIGFNIAHAYLIGGRGDPLTIWRCVVASLPPVLMILSFQVLIAIVKWVMLHLGRPLNSAAALTPTMPGYGLAPAQPLRAVPTASGLWAGAQLGAFARQPKRAPDGKWWGRAGRGDQAPPGRGLPRPARPRSARPAGHVGAAGRCSGGHRRPDRPGPGGIGALCPADPGRLDRRPAGERRPSPEGWPVTERRRLPAVAGQHPASNHPAQLGPGELLAALGELGCARAAVVYAALGFPVVPMHAAQPIEGCSCADRACSDPGKHPRLAGWKRLASTDPAVVGEWWRRWPQANLALVTGRRFDVLDLDGDQGVEALRAVLSIAPTEHPGPVAHTGGGGWHLLYAPTGLGNRVRLLPGMDWRGRDGLIVAPPSRHASGTRYTWVRPLTATLPEVPAGLRRLLAPPAAARTTLPPPTPASGRGGGYGRAALARERAAVAAAQPGRRNATLNRAAFNLGQLVAGRLLEVDEVRAILLAAALEAGNPETKARATIESGLRGGAAKPRCRRDGAP